LKKLGKFTATQSKSTSRKKLTDLKRRIEIVEFTKYSPKPSFCGLLCPLPPEK
jgi:hypothetical protein